MPWVKPAAYVYQSFGLLGEGTAGEDGIRKEVSSVREKLLKLLTNVRKMFAQ